MKLEIVLASNTTYYDLLSGISLGDPTSYTEVLKVHQNGRASTRRGDGLYDERFYLLGKNNTSDQRTGIEYQKTLIENMAEAMRLYISDPNYPDSLFLLEQSDGEADPRRALIYDIQIREINDGGFTALLNFNLSKFEMILTRGEWESDDVETTITGTNLAAGGKITVTNNPGTLPSRMARLKLDNGASVGTGVGGLIKHWLGYRPTYYGTSSFVAEWDWTAGTMGTDASVVSSEVQITFNTLETMTPRVTLKLSDIVGSNYDHFVGEYTLIMAYTMTGGASTRIAMKVAGDGVESEPIYGSATSKTVEIGTIRIPSQSIRDVTVSLADVAIIFSAERVASTGTLSIDKVYAVPNKQYVFIEGELDSGDASGYVELRVLPDGRPLQVNSDGSVVSFSEPQLSNWQANIGDGILIYVGGTLGGGVGGGVDLELDLMCRWSGHRYEF